MAYDADELALGAEPQDFVADDRIDHLMSLPLVGCCHAGRNYKLVRIAGGEH